MKYNCNQCNFFTNNKTDFNRHLKTKKHKKNCSPYAQNSEHDLSASKKDYEATDSAPQNSPKLSKTPQKWRFSCDFCGSQFSRSSNLTRHKRICVTRETELKRNSEIHEMEKLKIELNRYKAESEYYKKLLDSYSNFAPRTINSLTYIMNNYDQAPHIKAIDVKTIEQFNVNDVEIVESLIYSYRHKKLHRFLGDIVLSVYKKNDPSKQSIWTTDTSRLTYIIRELLEQNYSNWIIDKKGVRTKEYLINPLMNNVKKLLLSYQENQTIDFQKYAQKINIDLLDNYKTISLILEDIEHGCLGERVLKYLANKLYHNADKKLIKLTNEED